MKMENSKQKKIRDMKLVEIAEMMKQGLKQKEIAQKIGTTQQNISYRVGVIRAQYPDLLLP
jgi:transcriptional regulator